MITFLLAMALMQATSGTIYDRCVLSITPPTCSASDPKACADLQRDYQTQVTNMCVEQSTAALMQAEGKPGTCYATNLDTSIPCTTDSVAQSETNTFTIGPPNEGHGIICQLGVIGKSDGYCDDGEKRVFYPVSCDPLPFKPGEPLPSQEEVQKAMDAQKCILVEHPIKLKPKKQQAQMGAR